MRYHLISASLLAAVIFETLEIASGGVVLAQGSRAKFVSG